jgi:hypothetical protein
VVLIAINPFGGGGDGETRVVTIAVATDNAQQAPVGTLGFPLVATRNTTRISGPDPTADAAAAALATHPPAPGAKPLQAAILVPDDDWQAGVAASVLAGPPTRIPVLVSGRGSVGSDRPGAFAAQPTGRRRQPATCPSFRPAAPPFPQVPRRPNCTATLRPRSPNSIDQLRQRLMRGEPEGIVGGELRRPRLRDAGRGLGGSFR